MTSLAVAVADLSEAERAELWANLTEAEIASLLYDWDFWAREEQQYPEGDWTFWILMGGRGAGKTRTGAECVRSWHHEHERIALVSQTKGDGRDVMIEGDAGILAVSPPDERPSYEPTKRRLSWPNGSVATLYSGDEPDQLRGPAHEVAWVDELSKFKYPQDAWDNLMLGLRLGQRPRACVTMTPRPIPIVKALVSDRRTHLTRETTFENLDNLAPSFREEILTKYEGTRLGRQELLAEILDEVEGALWTQALVEQHRVTDHPDLMRIVVGVDPPGSIEGAEAGIVAAGAARKGDKVHYYVLDDRSLHASPDGWGKEAVAVYRTRRADRILGERNFGGDMVESTIRTVDPDVSYRDVVSSRGKQLRAEPIAALSEQGRLHMVGSFPALEDELTSWVPGDRSPNRMDAMVFAVTELLDRGTMQGVASLPTRRILESYGSDR